MSSYARSVKSRYVVDETWLTPSHSVGVQSSCATVDDYILPVTLFFKVINTANIVFLALTIL